MAFIEPCFGIGHNLSLICQMTSEDIKHQLIIIDTDRMFLVFLNVISLYVCNFLWEDNWYCTSLIVILLSLCLPNHFLSVYKNMSDCMQKHPAADVLISFASLRSAYESTLETLSYKQVRDPWDACMKLQFLLALFVKPLFFKWHKGLHWLPHARTYVCMHMYTHTHTHTHHDIHGHMT